MNHPAFEFNVSSIEFIAVVLLAASVFFWLPSVLLRQTLWACGNALVIWFLLPNLALAGVLAIFVISGYIVVRVLRFWPSGWLLSTYIALLAAAFVVLQQYTFLDWLLPTNVLRSIWEPLGMPLRDDPLHHAVRIVGLSYMLFRQIHVLVDAAEGQIERISLWSYLNYQLNLFTILAGPIQRFQDFRQQWQTLQPAMDDLGDLLANCRRIIAGVFKMALVAVIFQRSWNDVHLPLSQGNAKGVKYFAEFLILFYCYPLYLYFNFAGYCDIVIAASRFFGMRLPENFDRPYLARNVIDFWSRWHITLGTWIRDYLFLPMYKPIVQRWPKRAATLAYPCFFIAFAVAGIWHGSTANFLIYGLLQGTGAALGKWWENRVLKRRGRAGLREYLASRRIRVAAIVIHLHFQCLALMFFQPDVAETLAILRGLIPFGT